MKAMLLNRTAPIDTNPLQLADLPLRRPGAGELLVKVSVCGLCRTDLHVIEGELPQPVLPLVPGHQVVGEVVAVGDGCRLIQVGERVGIAWLRHTCGRCEFCRSGRENLCGESRYTGYQADGGYAEYAVVPEGYAYFIPEAFSDEQAAPLLCAGIIGYRALSRARVPAKGTLGLIGFGSSAHVVLQIALARGYRVVVVTRGESHRKFAASLGAHWVGEKMEELPERPDSFILFAPAGELVPPALKALKKGGTLALAGIHLSDIPGFDYTHHLFDERTLTSVTANTREDGQALLLEAARIPVNSRVTVYPLEEANRALQDLKWDGINGTGLLKVT